jgi:hypothetical protein
MEDSPSRTFTITNLQVHLQLRHSQLSHYQLDTFQTSTTSPQPKWVTAAAPHLELVIAVPTALAIAVLYVKPVLTFCQRSQLIKSAAQINHQHEGDAT